MAKNEGKLFENDWKDSYKNTNFFYMRLKDSNKFNFAEGTRFTPKNPCDGIQFTMPFLWLLELKSTKGSSISFAGSSPMIKSHQVKELSKASNHQGVLAGFILNFRPRELKSGETENKCYFVHIDDFIKFTENSDKNSFNIGDAERLGIEIENHKKISRYTYNIKDYVGQALEHYVKVGYIDERIGFVAL